MNYRQYPHDRKMDEGGVQLLSNKIWIITY